MLVHAVHLQPMLGRYMLGGKPISLLIQGLGQLTNKVQLRPSSLSSKFHKQLAADATKKHTRVSKVKATATIEDPNKIKAEREKAEEERIRSRENLQRRQVGFISALLQPVKTLGLLRLYEK